MARKIVVLNRVDIPSDFNFMVAFWPTVPTQRQTYYANANKTSQVRTITAPELAELQSGQITEVVKKMNFSAGTPQGIITSALVAEFNKIQDEVNGYNEWNYYGTSWDGTSWTLAGIN